MDLALHLDRSNDIPLQEQLSGQLKQAILDGRLPAGSRLPSTRSLAQEVGVSRNVVLAAYDDLLAEGYVEPRRGSGTYVAEGLPVLEPSPPASGRQHRWLSKPAMPGPDRWLPPDTGGLINFQLGRPGTDQIPGRIWRRLWREMALEEPPQGYCHPAGDEDLRAAIAAYLGRSRGIACTAESVIITNGALQALDLIARATLEPGDPVGFEEPGYPRAAANLMLHGARLIPLPVSADGLSVDALEALESPPLMVYTTPSHQYPTGARMPVAHRLQLLDWAARTDSLIIEDDYDSEFRFDAAPLPALASFDREGLTAYVGTFSKMVAPSLHAGYVVAPPALQDRLVELKRLTDFHTSWPLQRVLTGLIASGELEQHIRRMRRHYSEKRKLLGEIFAPLSEVARLEGLEAGLHAFLALDPTINARKIAAAALRQGVYVETIDSYYLNTPDRNGLLLGYGALTPAEIERGASALVEIIRGETGQ